MDNISYWQRFNEKVEFTTPLLPERIIGQISPEDRILDIGCGYGRMTEFLYEKGYRKIVGIDPSPNLIRQAVNSSREKGYNIDYFTGTLESLIDESKFDFAMMCGVIEYFISRQERENLIRNIHAILSDTGKMYLETFVYDTNNKSLYDKAKECGLPDGSIVINEELRVFHDTVEGIDRLFGSYFEKISGNQEIFRTWKNRENKGYEVLFRKRI